MIFKFIRRYIGVIFTQIIVIFIYTITLANSLLYRYPKNPTTDERPIEAKIHLVLFTILTLCIQSNFWLAVFIGPGYVPEKWRPKEENEKFLQYCERCDGFKAPRSHHCRRLNRCILKMDHYCPWIGTCVGLNNHASFVRFLFFVPITTTWACWIIIKTTSDQLYADHYHLQRTLRQYYTPFSSRAILHNFIAVGAGTGTIIAVGLLFYHQIRIILSNKTSIEKWICDKALDRQEITDSAGMKPTNFTYPYDLGKLKNFQFVFGSFGLKTSPGIAGLLDWPVISGCGQFDLTIEQLAQKALKKAYTKYGAIIKPYSGWWCPCSFGIKDGCFKIPCTDENRVAVKEGYRVAVTRQSKNWFYGSLIHDKDKFGKVKDRKNTRGWFPSVCVEFDSVEESSKDK